MSHKHTGAEIAHAMRTLIPQVDPTLEVTSFADADELQRGIIKLQKMRDTKVIQYKQLAERMKKDRDGTMNAYDKAIYLMDQKVQGFLRNQMDQGELHYDLPSGRMQISKTKPAVVIELDDDALHKALKGLYKHKNEMVKACAKVELKPSKVAMAKLHKAIADGDIDEDDVPDLDSIYTMVQGETVSYTENKDGKLPEPDRSVGGGGPVVSGGGPAKESSGLDPMVPEDDDTIEEIKKEIDKDDKVPFLPPDGDLPGDNVDASKKPKIYEAPATEHFDKNLLALSLATFRAMDVDELLAGQDKVKREHIAGLPMDQIKGGLGKMFERLGFEKSDKRAWVAYHIGKHPLDVDPTMVPEPAYRKLLALAIHAVTVKENESEG